jgi:hypothetical protein
VSGAPLEAQNLTVRMVPLCSFMTPLVWPLLGLHVAAIITDEYMHEKEKMHLSVYSNTKEKTDQR